MTKLGPIVSAGGEMRGGEKEVGVPRYEPSYRAGGHDLELGALILEAFSLG